ncbi:unnamed protein product [Closterium sp. Yama58-4]|nr:unnamed protein product [Closterium sp. Yama58-4]
MQLRDRPSLWLTGHADRIRAIPLAAKSQQQEDIMTADAKVVVGSFVWVEDPEQAWVEGEVVKVEKKKVTVKVGDKETVYRLKHIHPKDPDAPSGGVDDMTKLAYLHEPGVLHNLAVRYSLDEIYTYTGSILIAVNPFQRLPHLYDVHMMEQYRGSRLGELSPHVFAIAETSYRFVLVGSAVVWVRACVECGS